MSYPYDQIDWAKIEKLVGEARQIFRLNQNSKVIPDPDAAELLENIAKSIRDLLKTD